MVLYSLHVFDRSGRCLFDREWNGPRRDDGSGEHPRLVFGMLHSLGEVSNKLAPRGRAPDGHITVRTDNYALHAFEALSGYRFVLLADAEFKGDPRAVLLPTQARADLPHLLAAADVGLAPLRSGMAGTCIPSKMFGIMAAGRPVVAGLEAESDAGLMVRRAKSGLVVPPEDANALAAALRQLYGDRDAARQMGASARKYVETHHSQDVVVDQEDFLV